MFQQKRQPSAVFSTLRIRSDVMTKTLCMMAGAAILLAGTSGLALAQYQTYSCQPGYAPGYAQPAPAYGYAQPGYGAAPGGSRPAPPRMRRRARWSGERQAPRSAQRLAAAREPQSAPPRARRLAQPPGAPSRLTEPPMHRLTAAAIRSRRTGRLLTAPPT